MQTYHLTWATVGRQPILPTETARRQFLHALAAVAGAFILLFALVDDHIHLVIHVDPTKFGLLQRSLSKILRARASAPLARIDIRPVETRGHLKNLVSYCLNQPQHHGLPWDPATTTGSCFPDLVGARRIPGLSLPLATTLPRFQLREAFDAVGIPVKSLAAVDNETIRGVGAVRLAALTADALAVDATMREKDDRAAYARRVFAALAAVVGFSTQEVASALAITPTATSRLSKRPVESKDLETVRLRVALALAAAARPIPEPTPQDTASYVRESAVAPYELAHARGVSHLTDHA